MTSQSSTIAPSQSQERQQPPVLPPPQQTVAHGRTFTLPDASTAVNVNALVTRTQRQLQLSPSEARRLVNEYLCFLELKVITNDWNATKLSPSAKVDEVWHMHVLDSKSYAQDCQTLCKQMIHHNPDGDIEPQRPKRYQITVDCFRTTKCKRHPYSLSSFDLLAVKNLEGIL